MIRFIIAASFLALFCLFSWPLFAVVNIIGKFNPQKKVTVSQDIAVWGFKVILKLCGTTMDVKGLENVPEDVPVLYVANHRSYFDIVTCYTLVKNNTGFIAKKSMEKFPSVNRWMKYINCQFLDRDDVRQGLKVILRCIDLIKEGTSIFVFPEGTRKLGGKMLPFKEGSFKIATKTGCPIIPIAIKDTEQIFEAHLPRVEKKTVSIEFGKPIYPGELSAAEKKFIGATVQEKIRQMLAEK